MRFALVLASLTAVPASADAASCVVKVLEAPPAIAAEIEKWVASEPTCDRSLEVRVAQHEDGYAVTARDQDGHAFARVVPDPTSVAVLVVSWMAGPDAPPVTALANPEAPQIELPVTGESDDELPWTHPNLSSRRATRTLALGVVASDDRSGVHAQVDVVSLGRWSFGVAGNWRDGGRRGDAASAAAFAALKVSFGRFALRVQLGAAVDVLDDHMRTEVTPALHGAALVDLPLTRGLGLVGGPILDVALDRDPDVAAFVGLRYER